MGLIATNIELVLQPHELPLLSRKLSAVSENGRGRYFTLLPTRPSRDSLIPQGKGASQFGHYPKEMQMIQIEGRLTIKSMKGSRGTFCVGELVTDIGTFKVKDQVLDQYEEGTFHGNFMLSQVYLVSYMYFGRFNVEMRAKISEMTLEEADGRLVKPTASQSFDPDPLDEKSSAQEAGGAAAHDTDTQAKMAPGSSVSIPAIDSASTDDRDLFGSEIHALIERGEPIKLDPTIDRAVFRVQRDRLKQKGYSFEPTLQQWLMVARAAVRMVTSL